MCKIFNLELIDDKLEVRSGKLQDGHTLLLLERAGSG